MIDEKRKTALYSEIRFVARIVRIMYQKINHREASTVAAMPLYIISIIIYYQYLFMCVGR